MVDRIGTALFLATLVGLAGGLTWLDAAAVFEYVPYLPVLALCILFLLSPARASTFHFNVFVVFVTWLLILPGARTSSLKGFFIDCRRVGPGMSVNEARDILRPYLEVGPQYPRHPSEFFAAATSGGSETREERASRIIFIPDKTRPADWCVVYPSSDRVRRTFVDPD